MKEHLSVRASWLLAFCQAFERRGHSLAPLLSQANIDISVLHNEHAHIDIAQAHSLVSQIIQHIPEPEFGLEVGEYAHPTIFGSLGFLLLSSSTLKEALFYLEKYLPSFCNIAYINTQEDKTSYKITIETWTTSVIPLPIAVNTFFSVVFKFLRQLTNNQLELKQVTLNYDHHNDTDQYVDYFKCPVQFSSNSNSLVFSSQSVKKKLPTGNPQLSKILERQLIEDLTILKRVDLTAQIYCKICQLLPKGIASQNQIAKELNMSVRKLQLQLQRENTSYSAISNQVRQALAKQYITDPRLKINEIAHGLGFANSSNFQRSFKRWFGVSPSEFRREKSSTLKPVKV